MTHRNKLKHAKRLVVKIGSSLLTAQGQGLDHNAIADWVKQIAALYKEGVQVLLVSSGAVAEGMMRMGWTKRPNALYELQAAAAIGQMGLIQTYESFFKQHDIHTAQVLLTHDDLSHRKRYLNARTTLKTLLDLGVIPVINENDTVTTDEFRFGDNDSLAALVANLVEADALILLTDQAGVFDNRVRHGKGGDGKRPQGHRSPRQEGVRVKLGGRGQIAHLSLQQAERIGPSIDRYIRFPKQKRSPCDMVLVGMGKHQPFQVIAPFVQKLEPGVNDVHADPLR